MKTLYVVATPIGNLSDITLRAIETLKSVDVIACENTRRTKILLEKYGIKKKLISYFAPREDEGSEKVLRELEEHDVALVVNAGTPCISDPGIKLVRRCIELGAKVVPIPGPFAGAVALSGAGVPASRFVFLGFPPKKGRKGWFEKYKLEGMTYIIYESPQRVTKTLEDIKDVFGEVDVVIARELTKIYEEFIRGRISEVTLSSPRGEITIIFSQSAKSQPQQSQRQPPHPKTSSPKVQF